MKVSSLHPCLVFVCLLSTRSLLSNTIQDRRATPTPPPLGMVPPTMACICLDQLTIKTSPRTRTDPQTWGRPT